MQNDINLSSFFVEFIILFSDVNSNFGDVFDLVEIDA